MTYFYYVITSNFIDKFIDVMGLNEYFLIFNMVKSNLKIENYRKKNKGKTIAIEGFRGDNKTKSSTSFMAA